MRSSTSSSSSRVKSCTACRQVKLRCDLRETYPASCSRCVATKRECRKDASFKRIKTRNRLEDLEEQLSRAQQALAVEGSATPNTLLRPKYTTGPPRSRSTSAVEGSGGGSSSFSTLRPPRSASPESTSSNNEREETWLDVEAMLLHSPTPLSWSLGGSVVVEYGVMLDLFVQFRDYYHPHVPMLMPVTSLQSLYASSSALFWAIAFTACRHHPLHRSLYRQLEGPFQQQVVAQLMIQPLNHLLDLHALLLMCIWPLDIDSQIEDTTWTFCGAAVNAALQMGLDKTQENILFGHMRMRRVHDTVEVKYRILTYMTCFQVSMQLSAWHGVRPILGSPKCLEKMLQLYDEGELPTVSVALTEIQRQVGRFSTTLEDVSPNEGMATLVEVFGDELARVERQYGHVWSDELALNLEAAKLYLYAMCINEARQQTLYDSHHSDRALFYHAAFQKGHAAAVRLIGRLEQLGQATGSDPACGPYGSGGCALLGHPKQHFRIGFFAVCFLLKYLDCNRLAAEADQNAARNAITALHRVHAQFASSLEHVKASLTIEMLGRALGPTDECIRPFVRSRMGASVMFNVLWSPVTARSSLQGAERPSELPLQTSTQMQPDLLTEIPWGSWDDALFDSLALAEPALTPSDDLAHLHADLHADLAYPQ